MLAGKPVMAPSTTSSMADAVSDSEIIAMVRGGNLDAYDGLYARHVSIASTVARRNVDNLSDADDVVAEAFRSVLQSLVEGKGPEQFFRGYLLSTVTRLSHHRNRNARRALPTADEAVLDHKMTPGDPVVQAFESHTVARAFRSLPERWQSALWYLDVERMKPAVVAPILGLSPNAVSALGVRAREGLRKQYLQMHVSEIPQGACTKVVPQLGSYVRGGLSKHAEAKVRDHLDECAKCTAVLLELRDVQATMRAVLLPLMTGVPLAAWGSGASGLGIAGQFPSAPVASGMTRISQPLLMSILAGLAVGLVVAGVGFVQVLGGQPAPQGYQDARIQTTGSARPTPAPSRDQSPTRVASEALPPLPALPDEAATPVITEPLFATPAPARGPAPASTPLPIAVPVRTPAPTPTPTPTANRGKISGTASRTDTGADPTTATLETVFTLSRGIGNATADFSINAPGTISGGSVTAPSGWSCSAKPLDPSGISCTTNSAQPGELTFRLNVTVVNQGVHTLTYGLSGTGIATSTFRYDF